MSAKSRYTLKVAAVLIGAVAVTAVAYYYNAKQPSVGLPTQDAALPLAAGFLKGACSG